MERFLLNIDILYKNFKVYLSCFEDLFKKKGIKTIIFYKEVSSLVEKLEDRDFIKFRKYTDFDDLKEQILNFSKEEIFYINTFDEKLVLLTNELKKLLNLPFTEKYEIFRNKDLQRKYLLESFPEATVNFQKIDFNKNEKLWIDFPCIIKPTSSAQSSWVTFLQNIWDFENFKKNISNLNKNLEARGFLKNDFIVEEFIDGEIFTLSYFVNDFWEYFLFPIVKVKSVQNLWIDDFSNYVRIIYKWLDLELDEEKLDIFIKKHIKIFWIKNTFVFHDMKKTNSWEFKTIEVNGRIGWYRLEMYKETFGVNMLSFIDKVGHLNIKENIFFATFAFYPYKEAIFKWLDKSLEQEFKKMKSFFSFKIISWKEWKKAWFTKNWFSALANLKLKTESETDFWRDFDFVEKNYKNFLLLE